MSGPFPVGAVIQDRLIGRISDGDEFSLDGVEWRTFDAWPELSYALAVAPSDVKPAGEHWSREREKARLRWANERGAPDRRFDDEAVVSDRRSGDPDRRTPEPADRKRTRIKSRPRFANEHAILKIVVILALATGLIALLAWIYGPVNPVPVRIR